MNKETGEVQTPSPSPSRVLEQSKTFHCVIAAVDSEANSYDLQWEAFGSKVQELSLKLGCDYWSMLHDKDFDADGNQKYLHWHLILRMKRSRRVVSAVIKGIANAFGINDKRVSVRISYDLESDIRYLFHLDDFDKARYTPDKCIYSDLQTLNLALTGSLNELTFEKLEHAYQHAGGSKVGIMRMIGVKLYRLNAQVIRDYCEELKGYAYDIKKKDKED